MLKKLEKEIFCDVCINNVFILLGKEIEKKNVTGCGEFSRTIILILNLDNVLE